MFEVPAGSSPRLAYSAAFAILKSSKEIPGCSMVQICYHSPSRIAAYATSMLVACVCLDDTSLSVSVQQSANIYSRNLVKVIDSSRSLINVVRTEY